MRYWDFFKLIVGLYNSTMKMLYIFTTIYIIYLLRSKKPYCLSYDPVSDGFPHFKFIYPGIYIDKI